MSARMRPTATNVNGYLLKRDDTILDAIKLINAANKQLGIVVDQEGRLLGTVTDGDIRRAILKGLSLDTPIEQAMHTSPTTAKAGDSPDQIRTLMKQKQLKFIPILDFSGRVVNVQMLDPFRDMPLENWVVIMAGGMGTRLRPLTEHCPKPMLKIGGKPILEIILESFIAQNFNRFFFTVNYKSEIIENHFGDGSRWDVEIEYVQEPERLGTAGSLSLLPERPVHPFIVMNGDLLTDVDFRHLIEFHAEQGALGTMCVRPYDLEVPFGVVTIDNNRVKSIDEKPLHKYFVNAGIYALDPAALDLVAHRSFLDMTKLFEKIISKADAAVFPLREYWLDIGRHVDLERAKSELEPSSQVDQHESY